MAIIKIKNPALKLLETPNGKIAGENLDVSFENISDTGTEGTKVASGTTAQRGSTTGQIRYNTDNNALEIRNNTQFVAVENPVGFTSVSPLGITPAENTGGGNNFTLTGSGFKTGATVKFIGNDGTEFNATSVSVSNSSTIVATAPELTASLEPFDVKITNTSGNSVQLDNQIQINASPVWQTASGTVATISDLATGTHATISATDADGDTVSYAETTSVLSGAGLSLNSSNGQITGNPTDVNSDTTYTFDVSASDSIATASRTFNIIVQKALDGSSSARAATSAAGIKTLNPSVSNGNYWINLTGGAAQVYCDFDGTYSGDSSNSYMLYQSFGNNNTLFGNAINGAGLSTVSAMQSAGWAFEEASGGQSQFSASTDAINYWRNSQYTGWLRHNTLNLKGLSGINKIGIKWASDYDSAAIKLYVNDSQVASGTGSEGLVFNGSFNPSGSTPYIELYEAYGINKIYHIFIANT